jgi:hypothetical protein
MTSLSEFTGPKGGSSQGNDDSFVGDNFAFRNPSSIVCAVLLGVASLTAGEIAFAAGSPPVETSFSFDIPANAIKPGACAFPVNWSASGKAGTILLPGNRAIFTSPRFKVVVTNLDDPSKSVTLTVPGAFHQTNGQNGDIVTVVTGRNLLGDPEAGMVLAIGTFSYVFNSSGELIQPLAGGGRLVNVCELID